MSRRNLLILVAVLTSLLILVHAKPPKKQLPLPPPPTLPPQINVPPPETGPYTISRQIPDKFYSYPEIVTLLQEWNKQAPEITSFGSYGKNRQNTDLHYLRIGTPGKPKILIHAAIHGNERLATSSTLGIMGKMLNDYKRNDDVTWIVKNRDVYFVPVFSPESYLKSREIEQGDPNRNWPYPGSKKDNTSSPIIAMREFFQREKFCAVIDGHTTGRDFFWPSIAKGDDKEKYKQLTTGMATLAGYSPSPVSSGPAGFAIDWYYWKGAVAILTEFGAGGHDQPVKNIAPEIEKTYKAYLYFMRNAPDVKLQGVSNDAVFKAAMPEREE